MRRWKWILGLLGLTVALSVFAWSQSTSSYRFRMTVEIETPQGLRTGSSVMEEGAYKKLKLTSEEHGGGGYTHGEAVVIDLPDGPVFALLTLGDGQDPLGYVWSGSVTFGKNHRRAQRLPQFLQAFALPGVQLYSLQKGPPAAELKDAAGAPIIDLAPRIDDFADTAAALAQLDLVIMTDSAVAHLAGAMGRPVWLLLGHTAHWLWLRERTDSPWYPSLRLFRPRAEGDWDHVFDIASAELMSVVKPERSVTGDE